MGISSVSKKQLYLEIRTKKTRITCDLKRHLSPRTVGIIMRRLPIEGHVHALGGSILYVETSLDSGIERARSEFKRGDIAFLPSTGSICFFLNNVTFGKTMTPIGRVTGDMDVLKDIAPGEVFCMYEKKV